MSPRHLLLSIAVLIAGCEGASDSEMRRGRGAEGPEKTGGEPANPSAGTSDEAVIGASAQGATHVVSDGWSEAPVRFGDNVKMLKFAQLKSEVLRVTGATSIDWASMQSVFGGADFTTTFQDDRTPSATKLVALRKIAFDACATLTKNETRKPFVFSATSPKDVIAAADSKTAAQVKLLFTHVFQEEPEASEVEMSTKALAHIAASGATPEETWTGLCVGYLTSMRFLAY